MGYYAQFLIAGKWQEPTDISEGPFERVALAALDTLAARQSEPDPPKGCRVRATHGPSQRHESVWGWEQWWENVEGERRRLQRRLRRN